MKTGRNDLCPCGSGKKYKHCCLNKTVSTPETANIVSFPGSGFSGGIRDAVSAESARGLIHDSPSDLPGMPQMMGFHEAADGVTSRKELEDRLSLLLESRNPDTSSIDEKLNDLYRKGVCTRNKAVSIDRSFPVEFLDHVPVMCLVHNLLNEVVASRTRISADSAFDIDGEFWKSLCSSNLEVLGIQGQFYLSDGIPAILLFTELSAICADELGFLREVDGQLTLSDPGIDFLQGKYRKRSYLQIARFLERQFSWFHSSFEEDGNLDLWEWCTAAFPLALLILKHLGKDDEPVDAKILLDRTADLIPLPSSADPSEAVMAFSDLFLTGYCAFLGYSVPHFDDLEANIREMNSWAKSGKEPDLQVVREMMTPDAWSARDLLYDIFIWEI